MKHLYLLLSIFILASSQGQTQDSLYVWKAGQLVIKQSIKPVDIDSITFKRPDRITQVTIGTQIWSSINLDLTTYRDGTPIPQVTDPALWANLTTGAWCYLVNESAYGPVYGKLYNWYAVAGIYNAASLNNPLLRKQLAPQGWHVPTDAEWNTLINYLDPSAEGGNNFSNTAGGKMKETGTGHWYSPNTDANNSSGFTALPGGYRFDDGLFYDNSSTGIWWSSSEANETNAYGRSLSYLVSNIGIQYNNKTNGFSVRCVKD